MGLFFADEHATPASQMGDGVCELMDTPEVSALKDTDTYEGLLALGKALCYQLRYREAVEVYTKAVEMRPRDIRAYRQRGARYISTLRPFEARRRSGKQSSQKPEAAPMFRQWRLYFARRRTAALPSGFGVG